MKIKSVKVENFKCINSAVIEFSANGMTIIEGDNELGKSSILSALMWFFTDTLLTDKWGVGENDIDDIIPVTQTKDTYKPTSVEVTFDNSDTFTKTLITKFNSRTGKPSGHSNVCYIGLTKCDTVSEWTDELYKAVGYEYKLKGFKQLNVMIDPLYALQKMESKELRELLIALGCNVTIDEVLATFEPMHDMTDIRKMLPSFRDNLYDMRKAMKVKVKECLEAKNNYEIKLDVYKDVTEFNDVELTVVDNQLAELRKQYYSIRDDESEMIIKNLESKIANLKMLTESELKTQKSERDAKYNILKIQYEAARNKLGDELDSKVHDLKLNLNSAYQELNNINQQIKAYTNSMENIMTSLRSASALGQKNVDELNSYTRKLNEAKNRTYDNYVTCPNCYNQFVLNPNDEAVFNANKQNDITRYTNLIIETRESIKKQSEMFEALKKQRDDTQHQLDGLNQSKIEKTKELSSIQEHIDAIESEPMDTSEIDRITSEMDGILNDKGTINPEYEIEMDKLNAELMKAQTNAESLIFDKKEEINSRIRTLDADRTTLLNHKSNWESKKDYKRMLEAAISNLNDTESLLCLVNEVIHKQIEMCNHKAYEKTGLNFVMIEETLSETIKEVCYLTVDGVQFNEVNTSKKAIYGTIFIKKVKELLNSHDTLPILFDRLESISDSTINDNLQVFKGTQFITTKVTNDETIKIEHKEVI